MVPGTNGLRRRQRKTSCSPMVAAIAVAHALVVCVVASCSRGCHAATTAAAVSWSAGADFTAAKASLVCTTHTRLRPFALCFAGGGGSLMRSSSSALFAGGMERRPGSSSSSKTVMMGAAKGKRGATGRPASRNGVGKKVRRILEPASPAEVSHCPVLLCPFEPLCCRGTQIVLDVSLVYHVASLEHHDNMTCSISTFRQSYNRRA